MAKLSIGAAAAAGVLAAFVAGGFSATAQTSNTLPGSTSPILSVVSVADLVTMMSEMGVATSIEPSSGGGAPTVAAQTQGGGRFVLRASGCDVPAEGRGCKNVFLLTAMSNAGLSYDDLNAFNGQATVTVAVNMPNERIVVFGRNIIVYGGHARELFKGTVYLFLQDVERFYNARQQAGAASVSYRPAAVARGKIDMAIGDEAELESAFGFVGLEPEIAAAIAHSSGVSFSVDYAPAD